MILYTGLCIAKKLLSDSDSKPDYLNPIFRLLPDGIPCLSSVFLNTPRVLEFGEELEVDHCDVPCDSMSYLLIKNILSFRIHLTISTRYIINFRLL